jgi:hypothetical protein
MQRMRSMKLTKCSFSTGKQSLPEIKLSRNQMNYRPNLNAKGEQEQKKLAIMIGWLGAKDHQMKSYLSYYHSHGFDTLSFAVGPRHVMFPHDAMKHMQNVWDTAAELSPNTPILLHAFSMGGYLFGQSLRCIENQPERYGHLRSQIRAQIFDSVPDHGSIAHGISKSFNLPTPFEKTIEMMAKGYLSLTHDTAGVEHRAASHSFHNNFVQAPALFYYSLSDPISRYQDVEQVMKTWKGNGIPVEGCKWEKSPHIQHGRRDPERYFGELEKLLVRTQLIESSTQSTTASRASVEDTTSSSSREGGVSRQEKECSESDESELENEKQRIRL